MNLENQTPNQNQITKRNQILITPKDLIEFMEAEEYSRFIEKTVERMVKSPDNDLTRKIAKDIDFSLWIIAKWES